jgi:hypothetical protein
MSATTPARIPGYTPEPEFAAEQGYSSDTQKKKRRRGDCPAYIVVRRMVHYDDEDKPRYYKSKRIVPPRSDRAAS